MTLFDTLFYKKQGDMMNTVYIHGENWWEKANDRREIIGFRFIDFSLKKCQ